MKIAAAQTVPKKEDIDANLADHYRLVLLAAHNNIDLIIFPELSITGYVLDKANELSFLLDDSRLNDLDALSAKYNIIIISGAPLQTDTGLCIASFIFNPSGARLVYTKQFLHDGEEKYYTASSNFNPQIELSGEKLSLAICADITHPGHGTNAAKVKSLIYAASIFYTPGGLANGYDDLSAHARNNQLNVLMANYGGPSCDIQSGGRSAFWTSDGVLQNHLSSSGEALLIASKENNNWATSIITTSN